MKIFKFFSVVVLSIVILSSTNITNAFTYSNDLQIGSSGMDVVELQTWLVDNGYLNIPNGVAKGYFGQLTKMALMAYQRSQGLPAYGFFGPMTREKIGRGNINTVVLDILPKTLQNMSQQVFSSQLLRVVGFATSTIKWEVVDGSLPPGVFLQKQIFGCNPVYPSNCSVPDYIFFEANISGTPTKSGVYNFTVKASNDTQSVMRSYKLHIEDSEVKSITVLSPNGGEKWDMRSIHQIMWGVSNATSSTNVDIYAFEPVTCPITEYPLVAIQTPDCNPGIIVLDKNIPLNTVYNWIVGTDIADKPLKYERHYSIKVCISGTDICDVSDGMFKINAVNGINN